MNIFIILLALSIQWTTATRANFGGDAWPEPPVRSPKFDGSHVQRLFGTDYAPGVAYVGRGSSGKTYVLWNTFLDKPYLVKVTDSKDVFVLERVTREAQTLNRLSQKNLIKVYKSFFDHDTKSFYQLMDFALNGNLKEAKAANSELSNNPLFFLRMFLEIAKGIQYLHSQGIVHADIKPQNIVLTADNTPLIIDLDLQAELGTYSDPRGSPMFMDPQLIDREWAFFNEGVDVFSLGSTIYLLNQSFSPPEPKGLAAFYNFVINDNYKIAEDTEATLAHLINYCRQYDIFWRMRLAKIISTLEKALEAPKFEFLSEIEVNIHYVKRLERVHRTYTKDRAYFEELLARQVEEKKQKDAKTLAWWKAEVFRNLVEKPAPTSDVPPTAIQEVQVQVSEPKEAFLPKKKELPQIPQQPETREQTEVPQLPDSVVTEKLTVKRPMKKGLGHLLPRRRFQTRDLNIGLN